MVYWPLMMGLLAGKLERDRVFPGSDGRAKYPQFQGEEHQKNLDLVEQLGKMAQQGGRTVAQLVINWTIHQPAVTAALCGAKRPAQVADNAGAMDWVPDESELDRIEAALKRRGQAFVRAPTPDFSAQAR